METSAQTEEQIRAEIEAKLRLEYEARARAAAEEEAASDDLELIAILAAAISAYSGEPTTKFRVVSFKHIK